MAADARHTAAPESAKGVSLAVSKGRLGSPLNPSYRDGIARRKDRPAEGKLLLTWARNRAMFRAVKQWKIDVAQCPILKESESDRQSMRPGE